MSGYNLVDIARNFEEMYAENKSGHIIHENYGADFRKSGMNPADDLKTLLERAAETTANKND